MKYTVVWRHAADDDLTRHWLISDSEQRQRISAAVALLDDVLKHRPLAVGEIRENTFRIVVAPPITLHYRIHEADRLVEVISIHFG